MCQSRLAADPRFSLAETVNWSVARVWEVGGTSELGGVGGGDRGGKRYVTLVLDKSREQVGVTAREEIKKPQDLIGKTVGYPRASGGHYYFGRYVKKYHLPMDQINVRFLQAPEMVAAL